MLDGNSYACGFLDGTVLATYLVEETLKENDELSQFAKMIRSRIHEAQRLVCQRRGEEIAHELNYCASSVSEKREFSQSQQDGH